MTCFIYNFNILAPYLENWDPKVKYNFIVGELSQQIMEDFKNLPVLNKKLFCYQNTFGRSFLFNIKPSKILVNLDDLLNQDHCELELFKKEV
jgi:hypothetical protein